MAYSKIIIDFISVPNPEEVIHFIDEAGRSFFQTFKEIRAATNQTVIPNLSINEYELTISQSANLSNIGVQYSINNGVYEQQLLASIESILNNDATTTYKINSLTPVNIIDIATQSLISWSEGAFYKVNNNGGYISTNYKNALNADSNADSKYIITSVENPNINGIGIVTITATNPNAIFFLFTNSTTAGIFITNENVVPVFSIPLIGLIPGSTPCVNIKINATTDELATEVISPFVLVGNTANPLMFERLRGETFVLTLKNAQGSVVSREITTPGLLSAENYAMIINGSPNGSTVVISKIIADQLNVVFSLDNITFSSPGINTFSGLLPGSFVLYIKDQFGCVAQKPFELNETGIYSPSFYISKSNSLRFANRVVWGDSTNYKTDENTLSCEVDVNVKSRWKEVQQFQSADVITTQFKSNYSSNAATVKKEGSADQNIPVIKKTNNIGIKEKMDARQYNIGDGKTGIYFLSGNKYDFATNAVVGTYNLTGSTPEFAAAGNYIQIGSAWFFIESIIFDEAKNADVIVFQNIYQGPEINVIVGSIFNREMYNVYEFTIYMVNYIDQRFTVEILNSDPKFQTIHHASEEIWVKVKHEDVLEIRYKNPNNTDIFYSTGIENVIRIPYTVIKGRDENESEVYKTDSNAVLLNANIYETEEFLFEPVTKEIWRKLKQALSHENVMINGVGYVKSGDFTTEGPLGESNLYVLNVQMMKTGSVFTNQSGSNLDTNESDLVIPGLIQTEDGFVSY